MPNHHHFLILSILILGLIQVAGAQPPRGPFVVSPKVHADKTVTFSYLAPDAKKMNEQLALFTISVRMEDFLYEFVRKRKGKYCHV